MKSPAITIWIHGTKPQHILPGALGKLHIDSLYKFMHCTPGLHKANTLDAIFHHATIAQTLHNNNPKEFPWQEFYLFGWSGILHPQERFQAAHRLLADLTIVVQEYEKTYHCKPFIRIISHSHGGNVALNLAGLIDEATYPFIINELILLACPVQTLTAPFIQSPLFSKVYSLHSHWDFVQIADPQGWPQLKTHLITLFKSRSLDELKTGFSRLEQEPFFSKRHFQPHPKLTQAVIKMNGNHVMHIQFMLEPFVTSIPVILEHLKAMILSPNHFEHILDIPYDPTLL